MAYDTTSIIATTAAVATATALIVAYNDYRAYVKMGPHGLPDNFWGWYKQLKMARRGRKDTTVPAPYDMKQVSETYGPHATESFFTSPVQPRKGSRPKIPGFAAPQRQVTETATEEMKSCMFAYLSEFVGANSTYLQSELSVLEGPVPAVQLLQGLEIPPVLKITRGEITHVHPPDGSTHMILSLADSKTVIEKGWGQRHRLSGTILGWGYTLIYAPRNEKEFEIWKGIVSAAARHCCADIGPIREL